MKFKSKMAILLAVVALVIGGAFMVTSGDAQAKQIQYQSADMFDFQTGTGTFEDVAGSATLTRTKKGISYNIYTSDLLPGTYTVWTVIFNRPQNCDDFCDGSDLNTPAVKGSIVYGTGHIVGPDGIGNFSAHLGKGSPPAGTQINIPVGTANGLMNPMKAEIHLVVRDHGPAQFDNGESLVDAQTTTFGGGCTDVSSIPGDSDGQSGDYECNEPQATVFLALAGGNDGGGDDDDD